MGETVTARVLAVLGAFSADRAELTLTEISRRAGLPLTTTHRIVGELAGWGALERNDGRYRIGLRLWEVGSLAPRGLGLRESAMPFLEDLYEVTRQNVQLAVLDGTDAVYLERISGRGAVKVITRVGGRLPLHATGVGMVLLAHADPQLQEQVLAAPLRRYTPKTTCNPADLRRTLAEVRRTGVAITDGMIELVALSIAAPVYDGRGTVAAALSVVVPSEGTDPRAYVPAVRAAARAISRALGAPGTLPFTGSGADQPRPGPHAGSMTAVTLPGQPVPLLDIDPFSAEFLDDPYPGHEAMREAGPVVRLERYGIWASARHDPVRAALHDPEAFCSSAGVGISDFRKEEPWRPPSLLLEADPPEHTAARRVVSGVLSAAAMRKLTEAFETAADEFVARLADGAGFDAMAELAVPYPLRVFSDAVGLPEEGRDNLIGYARMVFNTFGPRNERFAQAVADGAPTRDWIAAHCLPENLAPGGMGAQIHARAAAEGFTVEQGAMLVRSFLSAGVDTTVHGIGNVLLLLAANPDQYAALRADPGLARGAFEEALRLEAAVQTFFRTTTREVTLDGVRIPAGEKVLLFLAAANRDPRRWPDPDRFDPTRRATGHVGFGFGIHACLGMAMARMEGEAVLTALTRHVSAIEPAGEPRRMINNTLRGLETLPLKFHPAHD